MKCLFLISSLLYLTCYVNSQDPDPCRIYQPIPDITRRDAVYTLSSGETSINDRDIVEGWYGNPNFTLLNSAPGFYKCGGWYPVWRRDSLNGTSSMCVQTHEANCTDSFDIKMKDCGGFEVYKLLRTPVNRASYCFELSPDEPPSFSVKPRINVSLQHESGQSKMVFHCQFSRSTENLFYMTIWFVEGKPLYTFQPLNWNDGSVNYIGSTALTEDMLKANNVTKPGFNLQCSIRAQYHPTTAFAQSILSESQFVGVKILSLEKIDLREGQTTQIWLQLSVPFGCGTLLTSFGAECVFDLEVETVKNTDDCTSAVVMQHSCGIDPIKENRWNNATSLTLRGQVTSVNGASSTVTHLRFKTPNISRERPFWQDYEIGNVAVTIHKNTSAIEGMHCCSMNDPRIKTFDSSESFYLDEFGVFTFYKDEDRSTEVQIETGKCPQSGVCTCGVAIRVGRTIFQISHCESPVYDIGYTACGDDGDALQVRKSGFGSSATYYIYLPTGAQVNVILWTWLINVDVYPSVLDEGKSRGMCGVVQQSGTKDYVMRNGHKTTSASQFSTSWRVGDDANLFQPEVVRGITSSYQTVFQYCTCNESVPTNKSVTCSAKAASEQCKVPRGTDVKAKDCAVSRRRKRAILHDQIRLKRQITSSQSWNESTATDYCESRFLESTTVQVVKDIPGASEWINNMKRDCVEDIIVSGTTAFSDMAVATVRLFAVHEAMVNPVLSERDPSNTSAPTLFEKITQQTCPGDCSGKGSCIKGECNCNIRYGGEDCSLDLLSPPVIYDTLEDGQCDLATEDCQVLSVIGQVFSGRADARCRIEKNMLDSSGKIIKTVITSSSAVAESISEVECTLPDAGQDDVVIAYNISVSHSGDMYSNQISVLVYDSSCVTVNSKTRAWRKRDGYCTYKGRCYAMGDVRYDTLCVKCKEVGEMKWKKRNSNISNFRLLGPAVKDGPKNVECSAAVNLAVSPVILTILFMCAALLRKLKI